MNDKINLLFHELAKKSVGKSEKLFSYFGLEPNDYEAIYPLTKLQHNIYIDTQLNNNPVSYNVGAFTFFDGNLDIDAWKDALQKTIDHDPVLRSTFVQRGTMIYQAVKKKTIADFEYCDIRHQEPSPQVVESFMREKVNRPYESLSSIVNRHYVIRTKDDQFYLLITVHQILLDVLSAKLHISEVLDYYKGHQTHTATDNSFMDYVFYNATAFDQPKTIGYWKDKLRSVQLPELDTSIALKNYTIETFCVEKDDFESIKAYCREQITTPANYFKGLFSLLLKYYSEIENKLLFFENVNGRIKPYLRTVGLLFYPKPVVIDFSAIHDHTPIKELFTYLRNHKKESGPFAQISIQQVGRIVEDTGLNCFYNYLNLLGGANFEDNRIFSPIENCSESELHLIVEQRVDHFEIKIVSSSSTYAHSRFLDRLNLLSQQIISEQASSIGDLCYVLPDELAKLRELGNWDNHVPLLTTFSKEFETRFVRYADNTSIEFEGIALTYRELNDRANQLASHLTEEYHIHPDELVGVVMERSHHMLISILAILKSGGAYLPIDPEYPDERLTYILDHARPKLLIIGARHLTRLSAIKEVKIFAVDLHLPSLKTSTNNLDSCPAVSDLSYVMYTSGSTGKPKGVMIEHGGMLNHLNAKCEKLQLTETDVIAQNASQSFDISIWQFLSSQLVGAKSIVYSDDAIYDYKGFVRQVNRDGVTILEVVPSYLDMILDYVESNKDNDYFKSLRYLLVTGEELNVSLVDRWYTLFPHIKIINAYGPTEASDDITHCLVESTGQATVPIGNPINNAGIYIVDNDLKLRPFGLKGEILVSGQCVGRGYLNDKATSDVSFLPDPVYGQARRIYRTGDIGAWLPGGNIMFYGRKDNQVKIQGNRIELGEIEHIIRSHPSILDALVLCKEERNQGKQLIAFVVKKKSVSSGQLRDYLSDYLPNYMLPSIFKELECIPLTSNGKRNSKALLNENLEVDRRQYIAPRNETERHLAKLWSEVLGIGEVGMIDNFFEIGGHSLSAMQVIARVHEKFEIKIDLKQFFNAPTIDQLALRIQASKQPLQVVESGNSETEVII